MQLLLIVYDEAMHVYQCQYAFIYGCKSVYIDIGIIGKGSFVTDVSLCRVRRRGIREGAYAFRPVSVGLDQQRTRAQQWVA
jgi:hypothetical protein